MEKLSKESFRGIDYIRLQSLPLAQASLFRAWLKPRYVINIQVDEDILRDCVLFKHYEEWLSTQEVVESVSENIELSGTNVASSPITYAKVAIGS